MNHYETLEVSKEASEVDIKKAYRKLAHIYHPDKSTGNTDKFKQISEAYQVLSDRVKRSSYDRFGSVEIEGFSVDETGQYSNQVADIKQQQLVTISSLVAHIISQCIEDRKKIPELTKQAAQRIIDLIYGREANN